MAIPEFADSGQTLQSWQRTFGAGRQRRAAVAAAAYKRPGRSAGQDLGTQTHGSGGLGEARSVDELPVATAVQAGWTPAAIQAVHRNTVHVFGSV